MVATSRQLHSALDAIIGFVAIGGTVLAGLAADYYSFLGVLDVPALALAFAVVCTGLQFRGLALARSCWADDNWSSALIFVVSTILAILVSSYAELDWFLGGLRVSYRTEFWPQAQQVLVVLTIQFYTVFLAAAWFEGDYRAKRNCFGTRSFELNRSDRSGDATSRVPCLEHDASTQERSTALVADPAKGVLPLVSDVARKLPLNSRARSSSTRSARYRFAWPSNQELGQRRSYQVNTSAATGRRDRFPMPDVAVGRLGSTATRLTCEGAGHFTTLSLHVTRGPRPCLAVAKRGRDIGQRRRRTQVFKSANA